MSDFGGLVEVPLHMQILLLVPVYGMLISGRSENCSNDGVKECIDTGTCISMGRTVDEEKGTQKCAAWGLFVFKLVQAFALGAER